MLEEQVKEKPIAKEKKKLKKFHITFHPSKTSIYRTWEPKH
jgi:hypothetical protein